MKFKIGDRVKIKWSGDSMSALEYNGQIGIILSCGSNHLGNHYSLDVDIRGGGIWENELELVERPDKEIKVYGIVNFCKEMYK